MALEIERKFLVDGEYKSHAIKQYSIKQGYLSLNSMTIVRVRTKDNKAYLTIKSAAIDEFTRHEWEYEIPYSDALEMLEQCTGSIIHKTRTLVQVNDHIFEVDEFYGDNEGLVVAEIELQSEDESFQKPEWLGKEVTSDPRYFNAYLAEHPFVTW